MIAVILHRIADGSEAQKSTPQSSPIDRLFRFTCVIHRRPITPTKINRGGRARQERHVGPVGQKCR